MPETLDPASPASASRVEELGRIILAYSEITDRLQQSHEQMTQTVDALRAQLDEKNRLLERKNRLAALGEMAAGMAHEIRNPLGGIQLYASMLARDVADRPESGKLVQKIAGGVRHLESLVSQVLNFTREIVACPTRIELSQVVEQAMELCVQTLEQKDIALRFITPGPLEISADPVLLRQAVMNLILNACDACEQAGEVRVTIGRIDDGHANASCFVRVDDSGSGIPVDLLDRIFNPFFTTKDSGTGLGLSVVHRIAEAHNGTVTASNRECGGARFEMRF